MHMCSQVELHALFGDDSDGSSDVGSDDAYMVSPTLMVDAYGSRGLCLGKGSSIAANRSPRPRRGKQIISVCRMVEL